MDRQEVKDIAKLEVRDYFDHFLEKTLPCILEKHIAACPHGQKVSRWKWMLAGITLVLTSAGTVLGVVKYVL